MFDTHCHLNFARFENTVDEVIKRAGEVDVDKIIIPGTDFTTSKKAIEIAEKYEGVYAAVGIHPHHVFSIKKQELSIKNEIQEIDLLLQNKKVVAVGEVGLDKYVYQNTKYENYHISDEFIELQKELLQLQLNLAFKYKKAVILHNRKANKEILDILTTNYDLLTTNRLVFHCCEPDQELLDFAIKHHIFIGVDGDVTYDRKKQDFIRKVPLELLVAETDSPYLLPEPLRAQKKFPSLRQGYGRQANEPANIPIIAEFIASLKNVNKESFNKITTNNAYKLFRIDLP